MLLCVCQAGGQTACERLPSLVVCPPTLTGHWIYEVEKFVDRAHLHPLHYTGVPRERLRSAGSQGGAWGGSIRGCGVHYTGVPRERLRSAGSQGGCGVGQYGGVGCTTRGCLANASGQRGRRGGVGWGWVNTGAWGALQGGASRTPQVSGVAGGVWGGSIRGRGVYYTGVPRERLRSAGSQGGGVGWVNTGAWGVLHGGASRTPQVSGVAGGVWGGSIRGCGVYYTGVPRERLRSAGSQGGMGWVNTGAWGALQGGASRTPQVSGVAGGVWGGSIRGRGVRYTGVPRERLRSAGSQGGVWGGSIRGRGVHYTGVPRERLRSAGSQGGRGLGGSIRGCGVHYTGVPRERLRSAGSQGGCGVGQYGGVGCTTRGRLANASGQRGRRGGVGWVNTGVWGVLHGGASRTPQVSGVAGGAWVGGVNTGAWGALHGGASRTPQVSGVAGGGVGWVNTGVWGALHGGASRTPQVSGVAGGGVGWVNTGVWGVLHGGASRTPQVSGVAGGAWGVNTGAWGALHVGGASRTPEVSESVGWVNTGAWGALHGGTSRTPEVKGVAGGHGMGQYGGVGCTTRGCLANASGQRCCRGAWGVNTGAWGTLHVGGASRTPEVSESVGWVNTGAWGALHGGTSRTPEVRGVAGGHGIGQYGGVGCTTRGCLANTWGQRGRGVGQYGGVGCTTLGCLANAWGQGGRRGGRHHNWILMFRSNVVAGRWFVDSVRSHGVMLFWTRDIPFPWCSCLGHETLILKSSAVLSFDYVICTSQYIARVCTISLLPGRLQKEVPAHNLIIASYDMVRNDIEFFR